MATFYKNSKDMITAYEFGQVDTVFTRSVSASQYKSGINSLSIPYSTRQLETLLMNHRSYPLESLKIRQAIRYGVNVDLISKNVYMDMVVDAETPCPPTAGFTTTSRAPCLQPRKGQGAAGRGGLVRHGQGQHPGQGGGEGRRTSASSSTSTRTRRTTSALKTANMIKDMLKERKSRWRSPPWITRRRRRSWMRGALTCPAPSRWMWCRTAGFLIKETSRTMAATSAAT